MHDRRLSFYSKVLSTCIPDRDASILVVGGGLRDKAVLEELAYTRVVISNVDERTTADEYSPYEWTFQNAEALTYPDGCFDYVVEHAALHHCAAPHAALLEMYRVARVGALAIEARDSTLMRLLSRLGLTVTFEVSAVLDNDSRFGGVNNSEIPNFIYRWTEREVEKTITACAPYATSRFRYFYGHDSPVAAQRERGGGTKRTVIRLLYPAYRLFAALFPRQQNLFAFYVAKPDLPDDLHAWLRWDGERPRFDTKWAHERYHSTPPG